MLETINNIAQNCENILKIIDDIEQEQINAMSRSNDDDLQDLDYYLQEGK